MVWVRVRVKFRDSVKHSKVSKQNSNELTHIETTPRTLMKQQSRRAQEDKQTVM